MNDLERWRLILGQAAQDALGGCSEQTCACDAALSWLYDREGELDERDVKRAGGQDESRLNPVDWLNDIHRLFPKETIERLERDALERYGIEELVTNPDLLERVQPNPTLMKAVLRTKHLMNPRVLEMARKLVEEVVRQLLEKLRIEVRRSFAGLLERRRSTRFRQSRNFDFRRTLARNLKNYDPDTRRLVLEQPFFFTRTRRHCENWQVILLVDQSGSMLTSAIHSALTAACLWGLPGMRTHLVLFDTQVVDLTSQVTDPVETLMKVQLGGGTDIAQAVLYAQNLVENPRRAIVVLISDFFEGGSVPLLIQRVRQLCSQGSKVLGLAALDEAANPSYDRETARMLVEAGAEVGAMTPGELAEWIAEKMGA